MFGIAQFHSMYKSAQKLLLAPRTSATSRCLMTSTDQQCASRSPFRDQRNARPSLHYDVLGLTPKATHGEIKAAYYKLSMTYHPDKNQGSDSAALKFRQLNEAYEVLGDVTLRRRYDQGLNVNVGVARTVNPAAGAGKDEIVIDHRYRRSKNKAPIPTGRSTIYDYDQWIQNHYEDMLHKKHESKYYAAAEELEVSNKVRERRVYGLLTKVFLGCGLAFGISVLVDYLAI